MQELVHHSEAMLCSRRTKGRLTPCIKSSNLGGGIVLEPREELESSYVKKKSLLYGEDVSFLHSQGHAASTKEKRKERTRERGGGEEGIEEREATSQF